MDNHSRTPSETVPLILECPTGLLQRIPRGCAYVVVMQGARGGAFDTHDETARGVGTGNERVGFHPVGGVVVTLFGGEQGQRGGEGIDAKIVAVGQGNFAAPHKYTIADAHVAGAVAANFIHDEFQVIELELIVHRLS